MDIDSLNNKIIIIKDSYKNILLKKINDSKKLINVKIITLNELKRKYYFDYNEECIYYVCKKYNIICDIAKIYLDNLYYIDKDSTNEKIHFLYELKKDLINKNLIKENKLFREFLKNKDIILYNLKYIDKFYINIINEIKKHSNVKSYDDYNKVTKKVLYEADNQEEEISFVASSICDLLNKNVNIKNIKLANVGEDYYFIIKKVFKLFNIPVNLKSKYSISGSYIVNKFKELYCSDINSTFNMLEKFIKTKEDKNIYEQLINIVNKYNFISDYNEVKNLIYSDIYNTNIKVNKLKNAIDIIDFECALDTDDYVFLINFNEGIIPVNYKDEDYLSDKIKEELNISTSYELNTINTLNIQNNIKYAKNLVISYSKYIDGIEAYKSCAYSSELMDIEKIQIKFNYSHSYNKLKLLSLKDENNKFGTVSDDLILLNSMYKDEKYLSYDNKYKSINKEELYNYLGNKLSLSYTSINDYYKCKFKYYLNNVLRVNKYEDTFEITIGNIFHKILSECFIDNYDFDKRYKEEVSNCNYEFNNAEIFFLNKLKSELIFIIDTIKNQLNYTQLNKFMYEKEVIVNIDEKKHITFKGIIDKIMYGEHNKENVVVVIDYKTGNPSLNIKNTIYGLDMQLPIYIYLAKNINDISNVRIGGFYLQKILNNSNNEEDKKNNLKLQGYSNSDTSILQVVDSSYENSLVIKGMKTSSNGFYNYSKVISDDEIDKLSSLVKDKINDASRDILNASFDINPKEINGKLISCNYCKYKDICYMNNNDIIKLNSIGSDENE